MRIVPFTSETHATRHYDEWSLSRHSSQALELTRKLINEWLKNHTRPGG